MELSSRVEYALLALMELADNYEKGKVLKIGDVAARHSLPERYLEQILSTLRRVGIVQSLRGAKGGYVLVREPWQITLPEVLIAIEGENKHKEGERYESPTPEQNVIYEIWQQASQATLAVFNRYTIQDLCQKRDIYRQVSTMYYI
jgi:Rrf2 family protein